jgi:hypothetical protein
VKLAQNLRLRGGVLLAFFVREGHGLDPFFLIP